MSFKELYKNIIDQAKVQERIKNAGVYYEKHHIVPDFLFEHRCRKGPKGHLAGDPNNSENLVLLTFQEHLLCHYYLYEIYKGTRYEYAAGSALQFFFIKAVGNHMRQAYLEEVDIEFLNKMAYLRQIGLKSISNARRGKMPVVDAVTKESKGSVAVDHPKVLSGEWVHHSKGKPYKGKHTPQNGVNNNNFKHMDEDQKSRVMNCLSKSIVDHCYVSRKLFLENIKKEFTEFKKISEIWIKNRLGGIGEVTTKYNTLHGTRYVYNPYYRSISQRELLRQKTKEYNLKIGRKHYAKNYQNSGS